MLNMGGVKSFCAIILILLLTLSCARTGDDVALDRLHIDGEMANPTISFSLVPEHLALSQNPGSGIQVNGAGGVGAARRAKGAPGLEHGLGHGLEHGLEPGSYSVADPGVSTEEGTSPGYVPDDVWVIQYSGTTGQSPLVGLPQYVEISGPATIQVVASSTPNTLIFIANTHNSNIEFGDISTIDRLKQAHHRIREESDLYGLNFFATKDLMLSGKFEGVIDNSAISAQLSRNIARLDFTIKNVVGSGMTLRTVQLVNVPRESHYIATLVHKESVFPGLSSEFFDYPAEPIASGSSEGGAQTFVYYIPVNQRGVNLASTSSKTKPAYAMSYSTYLRLVATDAQGQGYVYKIYPGANLVNDYNLSANGLYVVELSVKSAGDASSDSRLEFYGKTDFSSSNSFILHPAPEGAKDRVFTIPIDKVNEFWASQDASLTIGPGDEWAVDLIWQDAANSDFMRFVDLESGQLQTTFSGTGPSERFAVTTKSGYEGNALIGLKKVGREQVGYLWSWHMWVTDYDPQYVGTPIAKQYIYSVPGGHVHRYSGTEWTSPTGLYKDKYIMDRSLGSRDEKFTTVGALFYQFGRKDPFPYIGYGNIIYDINGVRIPASDPRNAMEMKHTTAAGVTLATGVLNSTTYYCTASAANFGDWTSQGKFGPDYPWNNPVKGKDVKSIFDPCPYGWQVPQQTVWSDFIYDPGNPQRATITIAARDHRLGWAFQGVNGARYWPAKEEVGGHIFYPAFGYRNTASTMSSTEGYQGITWACHASSVGSARDLNLTSLRGTNNGADYRAYGFSVRCIQQ